MAGAAATRCTVEVWRMPTVGIAVDEAAMENIVVRRECYTLAPS